MTSCIRRNREATQSLSLVRPEPVYFYPLPISSGPDSPPLLICPGPQTGVVESNLETRNLNRAPRPTTPRATTARTSDGDTDRTELLYSMPSGHYSLRDANNPSCQNVNGRPSTDGCLSCRFSLGCTEHTSRPHSHSI